MLGLVMTERVTPVGRLRSDVNSDKRGDSRQQIDDAFERTTGSMA